ncbi:alanine racemase [Patescibacteria group bacterium]|nr:MAG: alanine racemase [Patescibacteria group bacterium]
MALPPKTWVEVSRAALRHNARQFKRALGPKTALMVVVKSNAYGHGLSETVRALRDHTPWFGVDSVPEAILGLKAAPRARFLVLGASLPTWIGSAARKGIRLSVSSPEEAALVARKAPRATVHLQIETGFTRLGILEKDLPGTLRRLRRAGTNVEGLFTHYANIEDTTEHSYARGQLARFRRALDVAETILGRAVPLPHTACSAAAILFPQTHFALARVGVSLYGLWPSKETLVSARAAGRPLDLRTALTWKTTVAQVKTVKAGTPVSYGLTERMPRSGKVAVLPVGYWDGYDRGLSSVATTLVRGRAAKVLGRVCMNMMMVDVSGIPGVRMGDEAVLIGRQGRGEVRVEHLAAKIGTINYEVVTRINPTLPRLLV